MIRIAQAGDIHVQHRHNVCLVMLWWRQGLRSTPTRLLTNTENPKLELRPCYGLICTIAYSIIVRWHLCIKIVPMRPRVHTIIRPKSVSIITVPHTSRNQTWLSPFSAHGCFIILCTVNNPELECNREGCVLGANMRVWLNSDVARASWRLRSPASQLLVATVCSTAYSGKEQRQRESPGLLASGEIHWWSVH